MHPDTIIYCVEDCPFSKLNLRPLYLEQILRETVQSVPT